MTTIHCVSLFLPNTVSFTKPTHDRPAENHLPSVHRRARSAVQLRTSTTGIGWSDEDLDALVTSFQVPVDENLFTPPLDSGGIEYQRKYLKPGRHALARTEAEWGKPIFNHPRSRAGPLPSASIRDFVDHTEEMTRATAASRRLMGPTPPYSTRSQSPEHVYDTKTWTVEPAAYGNAGLVNALRKVQAENEERSITWIGTLGFPTDTLSEQLRADIADSFRNEHQSEVVYCTDKDFDGHYAHHCKTILWPIFHYQMPDHVKSKAYADHSWVFYNNINKTFAERIKNTYKRGDIIWIHDYHLLLVPLMIREKLPDAKIGFFLHVAFPSSEIFRCLAKCKALLEGVLGADLIVFQIEEYATHFLQTCSRVLTVETNPNGVQLNDRFVDVTHHAIGVNPSLIEEARKDADVENWIKIISEKYQGKRIIVARDELDGIHGVRQKLIAFDLFLTENPDWVDKVVLIQIATHASDKSDLLVSVSEIVTWIGSAHASFAHQPLVFLKQDIQFSAYIALLTLADVLVVSPLRDGMNLTAHDYVCLQDGKGGSNKKHGSLILSEFAGCATVFDACFDDSFASLKINPWDFRAQANAIRIALELTEEEKEEVWTKFHNVVLQQTGPAWFKDINLLLEQACDEHQQQAHISVPRLSASQLREKYQTSVRRVFFIDYEGTLTPHHATNGISIGSSDRIRATIANLMMDRNNTVYIMSGWGPNELGTRFLTLPAVGLIAEDGCFVREYGIQNLEWNRFPDAEETSKWKANIRKILQYWEARIQGSNIEERLCSLTFHYDKSEDQEVAFRQAGECIDQINGSCKSLRVRAVPINKAILVEQEDFTKRTAATHVFDQLKIASKGQAAPDFVMIVGNDRQDECVFKWANELGKTGAVTNVFTITLGTRNTEAQASLTQGSTGLLTVLKDLADISTKLMPPDYFNITIPRNKSFPG